MAATLRRPIRENTLGTTVGKPELLLPL
jgi:hypothetical protein